MVPVLIVSHGALGLFALISAFLPDKWRKRVLVALCLIGAGAGAAVAVVGVLGESWRSTQLGDGAVVAGAASGVAWLAASVAAGPRGRAVACALVGAASSALIVSATTRWLVPMLLFWVCSTLAIAVLAGTTRGSAPVWAALFLSDALLVGALLVNWLDDRAWTFPTSLEGWPRYLLLAAAAVRAGALPVVGVWGAMRGATAPVAPLLVGAGFALAPATLGDGEPWVGAGLLTVAVASGIWGLWGGRALLPASGAVTVSLLLGCIVVAPPGFVAGALAAILAAGVIALWGRAGRLGGAERSLVITALPPWVGFIAVVAAASTAVTELAVAEDVTDKVPWTLVAFMLPAAFAASVVVAARCALTFPRAEPWWPALSSGRNDALTLLVARAFVILGFVGGAVSGEWLNIDAAFGEWEPRRAILWGSALLLGVVAAGLMGRRFASEPAPHPLDLAWTAPEPRSGSIAARALLGVTLLLAIASIATVGWFTFEGLRLGFL